MRTIRCLVPGVAALLFALQLQPVFAREAESISTPRPTYADLADLSDSAELVLRAQVRKLARVKDERAPGLKAGQGRYFVKAKTRSLLAGTVPLGESLVYLVDLPLDHRGRPPAIAKKEVLVFARPVPGRPGELQLVATDAQVLYDEQTEQTVRAILTEKLSPDAPGKVTGVREIIHVPGNLAGEGETQVFLNTADGSAASITVQHRPGYPLAWGASFSELVADIGNPPQPETFAWYRLACFLPNSISAAANLSSSPADRRQALTDYRLVLGELGACRRARP